MLHNTSVRQDLGYCMIINIIILINIKRNGSGMFLELLKSTLPVVEPDRVQIQKITEFNLRHIRNVHHIDRRI